MNRSLRHALVTLLFCAGALLGQSTTAPRDTSSLEKSLLGHWVSASGLRSHYFFAEGKLTLVDDDNTRSMTYTVLESNPKERRLRIRISTGNGHGHDRNLEFSPDSTSLISTLKLFDETTYTTPGKWTYVDAKQAP